MGLTRSPQSATVVKERTVKGFGKRLRTIRQAQGMTQAQLGHAVGVSSRVIAYYETDDAEPPGAMLVDLAKMLQVTSDELLGLNRSKQKPRRKRRGF
jgi:transcriptional regulator with XRE-family HTH domain